MIGRIRVELLTAALPGGGVGRGATLDRDVVADELGLPRIPARRMKGLLLEAAREIAESLLEDQPWSDTKIQDWIVLDELFGRPGQGPMSVGVFLDDLALEDVDDLRHWLTWASKAHAPIVTRESVLRSFTEERSQTRIDPVTGAPLTETLRRSRLLRRGLKLAGTVVTPGLAAAVDLAEALAQPPVRTLALACAGVKRLGLGRNRGIGQVNAWLELAPSLTEGQGQTPAENVTARAIQLLGDEIVKVGTGGP